MCSSISRVCCKTIHPTDLRRGRILSLGRFYSHNSQKKHPPSLWRRFSTPSANTCAEGEIIHEHYLLLLPSLLLLCQGLPGWSWSRGPETKPHLLAYRVKCIPALDSLVHQSSVDIQLDPTIASSAAKRPQVSYLHAANVCERMCCSSRRNIF